MAEESSISWTHATFNPWWGCTKVSPACENCYAERDSARFAPGLWGPSAPRRFFGDKHWNEPRRWNEKARKSGQPFRVFCASMADVFEDRRDLDAQRERLWALIEQTPFLTWLLLTKRPELMTKMAPARWAAAWPANVWAMTTVEDQRWAEKRIPRLLEVPAVVRGLSVEPMTGPLDLEGFVEPEGFPVTDADEDAPDGEDWGRFRRVGGFWEPVRPRVDWVIAGGESGAGARPIHPDWLRALRDQCVSAGVPFHVKQWGEWGIVDNGGPVLAEATQRGKLLPALVVSSTDRMEIGNRTWWAVRQDLSIEILARLGKKAAGRALDGKVWDEYPANRGVAV